MKTNSLITEQAIDEILDKCSHAAGIGAYSAVSPTPLVSPFWRTTFTPSSSETVFRQLSEAAELNPICSCLPCIRITDLDSLSDGWHLLYFHMVTFIKFNSSTFQSEFRRLLTTLAGWLSKGPSDLYYLASTNRYLPDSKYETTLGCDDLVSWGIPESHIFPCSGAATYQDASLRTSDGKHVAMVGPKVEVLYKGNDHKFREIATFEIAIASGDGIQPTPVSAFVLGLERVAALSCGIDDLKMLPNHSRVAKKICSEFLDQRLCDPGPGFELAALALFLFVGLLRATEALSPANYVRNKGLGSHYHRIMRHLLRTLQLIGINWRDFLYFLGTELNVDVVLLQRIFEKFVKNQPKMIYLL